jgi:PAS domain S-box-containing protein
MSFNKPDIKKNPFNEQIKSGSVQFPSVDLLKQKLHFEQTPLALIEWDTDLRVVSWNPAAYRIFGYSDFEAFGKSAFELIVPESAREHVKKVWLDLIKAQGGTRSTNENIRKDGKIILCDWYNTPIVNLEGNVIGISSVIDDITEREKSYKIQKALYQISQLVHTITDISQLYKEIHRIVSGLMKADNFYIALYDEQAQMISFPYFVDEIDSPPDPCKLGRGLTEFVLLSGKDMLIDAELDLKLRKQGLTDLIGPPTEIWLGVNLRIKNKPIGVIVVQDYKDKTTYGEEEKQILTYVSEQIASAIRKKMDEDALKKYSDELKALNSSKDRIFSIVAHDLRSPFHGILGLTHILKNEFKNLSETETKAYIDEIHNATSNLYKLIENLLDWSRLEAGIFPYEPKKINIISLIGNVESLLKSNATMKRINIKNNISANELFVYGDEDMLRSLFQNLISNAIKFTQSGGTVELNYRIIENNRIEFSIKDDGIGISKENIRKLFDLNESLTTLGTNREKGTGIGLLLCKEIVEKHEGEIKVESESGKGSMFIFTLKLM